MTAQIDDVAAAVVALTGGFIDLARAREAEASGRPDLAAEHLAAAQKRIHRVRAPQGIERPLVERSDDIRAAARILMPLIGSAR
jgi:hypothetical protein